MSQEQRIMNRPYIDERKLHYGFFIGLNTFDFEFDNTGYVNPLTKEEWYVDVDNHSFGFTVGVVGEWRMHKHFALRTTPTLHLAQRHIAFHEQTTGRDSTQNMKSTCIAVPIDVKITAPRYNNFRPYVLVGVVPMFDLTSHKHDAIRTNAFDLHVEFGLGCDLYLPFFKLIPELKFSFGLLDLLDKKRDDLTDPSLMKYTNAVSAARGSSITLTLYIE
ncbi:MAG: PorT family protein [Bacteroidaceae bacterium]|nr:PorT family protein [Bacteroidaceae bacterium]